MSIEFINKLVRYYDIGCNCVGGNAAYGSGLGYGGYPGYGGASYGTSPYGFGSLPLNPTFGTYPKGEKRNTNHTLGSSIKIVDNIVQLPHNLLNIQLERPVPPPPPRPPQPQPQPMETSPPSQNSNEADE